MRNGAKDKCDAKEADEKKNSEVGTATCMKKNRFCDAEYSYK